MQRVKDELVGLEELTPTTQALEARLPDVQAALTTPGKDGLSTAAPPQLRDLDLRGASLNDADLTDADGANLTDADLRGDLTGAHLERADLTGAHPSTSENPSCPPVARAPRPHQTK